MSELSILMKFSLMDEWEDSNSLRGDGVIYEQYRRLI